MFRKIFLALILLSTLVSVLSHAEETDGVADMQIEPPRYVSQFCSNDFFDTSPESLAEIDFATAMHYLEHGQEEEAFDAFQQVTCNSGADDEAVLTSLCRMIDIAYKNSEFSIVSEMLWCLVDTYTRLGDISRFDPYKKAFKKIMMSFSQQGRSTDVRTKITEFVEVHRLEGEQRMELMNLLYEVYYRHGRAFDLLKILSDELRLTEDASCQIHYLFLISDAYAFLHMYQDSLSTLRTIMDLTSDESEPHDRAISRICTIQNKHRKWYNSLRPGLPRQSQRPICDESMF